MIKCYVWGGVMVIGIGSGVGQTASAPAAPQPMKRACVVNHNLANAAETELNKGDNVAAEKLLRESVQKNDHDPVAKEELVRVLVRQDKVGEAAGIAEPWLASAPNDSMALVALGDVRLRQGDVPGASRQYIKAGQADPCNARAYLGIARVYGLAGMHASAKRLIDQAYALHPTDDDVDSAWIQTRPRKERLAMWTEYAEHSDQVSDSGRAEMKTRLEKEALYSPTDCKASLGDAQETRVPMAAVNDGPTRFLGWGLDVQFNGKRRRLEIDTGASGITISRAAALGLGIARQDQTLVQGVGDKGVVKTSVTHVASIKIGGIEFKNCAVDILEKWSVLDSDGLIGGDVFRDYALTLDFPKHELRLRPLAERPGEKKAVTQALETASDESEPEAHDPYIAPEMAKWERIYRSGHELLMPTGLVETKRIKEPGAFREKLFMLDTGAGINSISPAAAREVTKVSGNTDMEVRGISGSVDKVFEAGKFTLAFAGLRLDSPYMTSIDTTKESHGAGVEISGFIGAPALFQVVLHIDYRDNLVWCEYTPPK